MSCVVDPTASASATTIGRRLGMHEHLRVGMLGAQQFQLDALELVVHDAGALPDHHVRAGLRVWM